MATHRTKRPATLLQSVVGPQTTLAGRLYALLLRMLRQGLGGLVWVAGFPSYWIGAVGEDRKGD